MSAATQYRLYGRRFFTGQKTQPTVSKYWRRKLQRKTTQKTQRKHKIHICKDTQNSIQIKYTQINTGSPLVYNNGVTRGRLPQRAGLPGLNGSGAVAAVPPFEELTTSW